MNARDRGSASLFLRVLGYLRNFRAPFALSLGLLAGSALLELARPWPLKIVIDSVLGDVPAPFGLDAGKEWLLGASCVGLLFLQVVLALLAVLQNRIAIGVGQGMVNQLRGELVSHLHGLSLGFFGRRPTTDLAYRVAFDSFAVQSMVMNGLFPLVSAAALLAGMTLVMLRLNPALAAIFLVVAPLLLVTIRGFGRGIRGLSNELRQRESRFLDETQRGVGAMHVVQAFTAEERERDRVMRASSGALGSALRLYLFETGYSGAVNVLLALGTALVLFVGGHMALSGTTSAGELIVFVSYLASLYGPVNSLSQTTGTMQGAAAGARRVFEVLDEEPEVRDAPEARALGDVRGAVRFEGVSFRYAVGELVLRDVSFEAPAGALVALVGPSGAGKTTLASLIPRFHDPVAGRILLDGHDLRALRRSELRARIGIVPQSPVIFPASAADNIRYGKPDASDQELRQAAELAGAARFLEALPQGYATLLGPDGQHALSQGQLQRMTIARALLKDPRLLILDEPSSALDSETEALVMGGIERAMRGRTTFVIAHRLATVQRADLVLVLDAGRLVESGRFDALRRAGGLFQRLCEAQQLLSPESDDARSTRVPRDREVVA